MTAERKSNFKLTAATPYLALTGELCGVYYEDLKGNWPCYNGTPLYVYTYKLTKDRVELNFVSVSKNEKQHIDNNSSSTAQITVRTTIYNEPGNIAVNYT